MITLHILELLKQNGFGDIGASLHWEKLPDTNGIAIYSRGGPKQIGRKSLSQSFDLWSRGPDDLEAADKLEKIQEMFTDSYTVCELPETDESTKLYVNARIIPDDAIENLGTDGTGRVIFRLGARVIYQKGLKEQ